jgi:hypothetical protein
MSNPECLFKRHVVFCGTERAQPQLALYKITPTRLVLKDEIVLETDQRFNNEIMISMQRMDKQDGYERLLAASSHRRLFLVHVTPKKFYLHREFDLSFPSFFRLRFGVKTLYARGDFAVFYTDNHEKKNCVLRFLGYDSEEEGNTFLV